MAFIQGIDRDQFQFIDFYSIDSFIAKDNSVRVIDAFVNSLDLPSFGFVVYSDNKPGQRPYKTSVLLKIHLYCFFNQIVSSRKQERECARNIELMWLTGCLVPDHSTIANFCKVNHSAIALLFQEFNSICFELGLFDFKLLAQDGTKIKACCSKKNAFTIKKLDKSIEYIDSKIQEYMDLLDSDTSNLDDDKIKLFQQKLDSISQRKKKYQNLKQQLIDNNSSEICLTDPDAKIMKNHHNAQPCYNLQTVVDSKHKLIAHFDVSNQANDLGLFLPVVNNFWQQHNIDSFLANSPDSSITFIADAGYYKQADLLTLNSLHPNVSAFAPKPTSKTTTSNADFSKENFSYNSLSDTYTCPNNKTLHLSEHSSQKGIKYKIYRCSDCSSCSFLDDCTSSVNGRSIKRHPNEDFFQSLQKTYQDSDLYKQRKCIVEHPFGTIKFFHGFYRVFIKGIDRMSSWAASVSLCYNLRRCINIVGVDKLLEVLQPSI